MTHMGQIPCHRGGSPAANGLCYGTASTRYHKLHYYSLKSREVWVCATRASRSMRYEKLLENQLYVSVPAFLFCSSLRITEFLHFVHRPELYRNRKHSVSETGSVSAFGRGEGNTCSVGFLTSITRCRSTFRNSVFSSI
jgi:hypothetical protein